MALDKVVSGRCCKHQSSLVVLGCRLELGAKNWGQGHRGQLVLELATRNKATPVLLGKGRSEMG